MSRKIITSLWREPLVHFLLIGVALFVVYDLTREQASEAPNRIVMTSGQLEQLSANFKRTWMRPATDAEFATLIENYVREEVFYREALAMGLDQSDSVVRQRMRLKLEFILEDLSLEEVTDEVLLGYLREHPDKFLTQTQVSFQQVYLNPDRHADLIAEAEAVLASLNQGAAPQPMGDPTLIPYEFKLATQGEIERSLGKRFAMDVVELEPGDHWMGPVYSAYGGHLLRVSARVDARFPDLSEVRAVVEREYLAERKKELKDLAYAKLREGYDVTIEPFDGAQGAAGGIIATAEADEAQ
jgi:hypothetical protein